MLAVGIDPSLSCTGVAWWSSEDGWGTARAKTQPAADGSVVEVRRRLRTAAARTLWAVPDGADVVVVECPSARAQYGSHNERVGMYWYLVDQLIGAGVLVVPVYSKTRAMYATGNGNADKKAVKAAMRGLLPEVAIPDDNVADAVALALMGARFLGRPLDAVGPKQLKAYGAVPWPEKEQR